MKAIGKFLVTVLFVLAALSLMVYSPSSVMAAKARKASTEKLTEKSIQANAVFDVNKMSDMSDFDPSTWVSPTGDTIKIAVVASFSGPSALVGQIFWASVTWVAHDINKRGGILVDGKKKLIEVIKADHMGRADTTKKVVERVILQDKVHFIWGSDGSHLMKIVNQIAKKHKVISLVSACTSDEMQAAENFSRYSFQGSMSSGQIGPAFGYYFGQIRKKEKKFYILNQDYGFGHVLADSFKQGLKEYYPEAQIVGEDYHKLFLTDYLPYLSKVKASGAEVIFTGDWLPDAGNLLKQARGMNVKLPFANISMDEPNTLHEIGVEKTKGLIHLDQFGVPQPFKAVPGFTKFYRAWNDLWKNKWRTEPYNTRLFEHGMGNIASWMMQTYWLLSVVERAQSLDSEKIINTWEGDVFQSVTGKVMKMRACDHKVIQDLVIEEYVSPDQQKISMTIPPYYWFKGQSSTGPSYRIPAGKVLPLIDPNSDRCKGKNGWGE